MKLSDRVAKFLIILSFLVFPLLAGGPASAQGLDGRWEMVDEPGHVVAFGDGRYRMTSDGAVEDEGSFTIEGDKLALRSSQNDGAVEATFQRSGDALIVKMTGGERLQFRAVGPAAIGPAKGAADEGATPDPLAEATADAAEPAEAAEQPAQPATPDTPRQPAVADAADAPPPAAPQPEERAALPPVPSAQGVEGHWTLKPGFEVELSNGHYQVLEQGKVSDEGTYSVDGDRITLRTAPDGKEQTGRFARSGDLLLFEPEVGSPMLLQATPPTGAGRAASESDLVGRWRTGANDTIELHDGHYTLTRSGGTEVVERGDYGVDGDTLVVRTQPKLDLRRMRWGRFGERLVLLPEGSDEVFVLTRETPVGAAPLPAATPVAPALSSADPLTQPAPAPATGTPAVPPLPAQPQPQAGTQPAVPQPVAPQPAPAPPPLSDGTPLAQQWVGFLQGKRIMQSDQAQAGVQMLDLCSDGQYFWFIAKAGQAPQPQGTGYWSIVTQGQAAALRVQSPAGVVELRLDFDGQNPYLNGQPSQIGQNTSCR